MFFPHHTDGGLYECALLLREEEESEEEKRERKIPSSPPYPNIGIFTDLQHRNVRGEMGGQWENQEKREKREKREKTEDDGI